MSEKEAPHVLKSVLGEQTLEFSKEVKMPRESSVSEDEVLYLSMSEADHRESCG